MNLHKIISKIKNFLYIETKWVIPKFHIKNKRRKKNNKLYIKKTIKNKFIKKRQNFHIKNYHLEKLKIFWNNMTHYYILIFIILAISWLYVIFWPVFRIKNIEIIKQDNITSMAIAYNATDKYRWESIFNIEEKNILERLKNYQQNISDIKTDIVLPNTLKILINSYKWIYNTTINNKTFIITKNWTLIPENPSEELKTLIVKNKFNKNIFLDYKKTFNTEYIEKISNITSSLEENLISIKIDTLTYFIIERELHIETTNKVTLIFDLNWDYKKQIEKLSIFNKDYLNIAKIPIVYIDLRIKNKVFYCTTENEYQCIVNIKKIYSYE